MRVQDATDAVYNGLRTLDLRRYLCAIWIVCGGLRAIYADRLSAAEGALMTSTLDAVRDVAIQGNVAPGTARRTADLSAQWAAMASEGPTGVKPGQWNTWLVFRDLASEIAGTSERYAAAERVDLAATDRWREGHPGPLRDDPDEEVDELSPMARSLAFLLRAVGGVAELPETGMVEVGWDPLLVQEMIFAGALPVPRGGA
jgi:hypothetical protein